MRLLPLKLILPLLRPSADRNDSKKQVRERGNELDGDVTSTGPEDGMHEHECESEMNGAAHADWSSR